MPQTACTAFAEPTGVFLRTVDDDTPATLEAELARRGARFPPPEALDETDLPEALWRLVRCLALLHVYLHNTDHLSDRDLYARLWRDEITTETWMPRTGEDEAAHIDLAGSGSDEDVRDYLRYYASEAERRLWEESFPAMRMPGRACPPCDRDRFLPRRDEQHLLFAEPA